jgi:hypothetical protein
MWIPFPSVHFALNYRARKGLLEQLSYLPKDTQPVFVPKCWRHGLPSMVLCEALCDFTVRSMHFETHVFLGLSCLQGLWDFWQVAPPHGTTFLHTLSSFDKEPGLEAWLK